MRLPTPKSCPPSIASVIQQCFREQPAERPSFSDIKKSIETAYRHLRQTPTSMAQIESVEEENLQYADLQFEERYLEMKVKNRNYQENKTTRVRNERQQVVLDSASLTASFNNDAGRYLSIQNMSASNIAPKTTTRQDSTQSLLEERRNSMSRLGGPSNHLLSPGCIGNKRFFSYGGEDPTPLLQPKRLSTGLMPAQSYPNPSYMMMTLADLNSNETVGTKKLAQFKV